VNRWPSSHALLVLPLPSGDGNAGLRGASRSTAPWGRADQRPHPPDLRISFEDTVQYAPFRLLFRRRWERPEGLSSWRGLGAELLSWGCQRSPLHRHQCVVSTPSGLAAPRSCLLAGSVRNRPIGARSPSARSCHLPDSFRPCRSARLRRFAPPRTFQVCCALVPIMGFARFQLRQSLLEPFPAGVLRVSAAFPPGLRLAPEGVRFRLRRPDPSVSSEEATSAPLQRPALCLIAWAFPLAPYPSKLFPCRQLCRVNRAVRAPLGQVGSFQANLVLPSLFETS